MLLTIRPSSVPATNAPVQQKKQAKPTQRLTQDAGDQFIRRASKNGPKFGHKLELTLDWLKELVESKKALLPVAKQAAKDPETRQKMIDLLLHMQNNGYKTNRNIFRANREYLKSDDLARNYERSWKDVFFDSDNEGPGWSIAPC